MGHYIERAADEGLSVVFVSANHSTGCSSPNLRRTDPPPAPAGHIPVTSPPQSRSPRKRPSSFQSEEDRLYRAIHHL